MSNWLVLLLCAVAVHPLPGAPGDAAEKWKFSIQEAARASSGKARLDHLKSALDAARAFGDGDARLLETLVQLASPCPLGSCPDDAQTASAGAPWAASPEHRQEYLDRALRIRSIAKPADARLSDILMDLGTLAAAQGLYRDALACYHDAERIRDSLFGAGSETATAPRVSIARVYLQQGDRGQARMAMDHAIELRLNAGAGETEEFADLLEESAKLYSDSDDGEGARREYERALEVRTEVWGADDPRLTDVMRNIAAAMTWQHPAYAEAMYRRVIEAERKTDGDPGEGYYQSTSALAGFYVRRRRDADAERTYQKALEIRRAIEHGSDAEAARCLYRLASVRMNQHKYRGAAEAAEQSLAIHNALPADPRGETLAVLALLAEALLEQGDAATAERHYRDFYRAARLSQPERLIETGARLSLIHERMGDDARAAQKLEAVAAAIEAVSGSDSPELAGHLLRLSRVYERLGRPADALRANLRARRLAWTDLLHRIWTDETGVTALAALSVLSGIVLLGCVSIAGFSWLAKRLDKRLSPVYSAPATVRLAFHGETAPLFALRARNLLFGLLTFGLYAFWGKARVRQYLYAQAELEDDRLVFHGTGREMLAGWLKGLPVLAFILLLPLLLPHVVRHQYSLAAAQILALAAFFLLWPIARAGAHRYRMNRMSWRGIRFGFHGSTATFQKLGLTGSLLTLLTLGLYYPVLQVRVRRFLFEHSTFGDHAFSFSGRGRDLVPRFLFALPLTVLTLGLFWPWWSALRHRYFWAHTGFNGARFRSTVTGAALARLWLGNAAILLATFGLGLSWVTVRNARFYSRHIELSGDPGLAGIRQLALAHNPAHRFGDYLGFDFGL